MTWVHLVDWLTGIASFGVKFIGYPSQIRRNKAVPGVTVTVAVTMCISYVMWVLHGFVHHDWVEILSQGIGAVMTAVLVFQAIRCRRNGH